MRFPFVSQSDLWLLIPAVICLCVCLVATPLNSVVYGKVFGEITRYVTGKQSAHLLLSEVTKLCGILMGIGGARLVISWILVIMYLKFGERVQSRARTVVYCDGILATPMDNIEDQPELMGKLSQLNRCIEEVRAGHADAVALFTELLALVIGLFVTAMIHSWSLTLVIFCLTPLMIALTVFFGKLTYRNTHAENETSQRAAKVLDWCLGAGVTFVRVFDGMTLEHSRFKALVKDSQVYFNKLTLAMQSNSGIIRTLTLLAFAQGFWFGNTMILRGVLSVAQVFTCFSLCLILGSQMFVVLSIVPFFIKAAAAQAFIIEYVKKMASAPPEEAITSPKPEKLCIKLDKVSFAYRTRPTDIVLKQVTLNIEPGITYVVGPLGCGKSTIALLIMGVYKPTDGKLELPFNDDITLVEQFGSVFPGLLVYDNIALAVVGSQYRKITDVPRDLIEKACAFAAFDEVVASLPSGLDTKLESSLLLGGQHQRLLLARAWLRNTPVLILDESLLALDPVMKTQMSKAIKQWRSLEQITLIITHDYDGFEDDDRVIVMNEGNVAADGTTKEVLKQLVMAVEEMEAVQHHQLTRAPTTHEPEKPKIMSLLAIIGWFFTLCPSKMLAILGIFLLVAVGILNPVFLFYFSQILQIMVLGVDSKTLTSMSAALIGIAVGTGLAQFLSGWLLARVSELWIVEMRIAVMLKLGQQSISYMSKKSTLVAEITALVLNDTRDLRGLTSDFVSVVVSVLILVIGGLTWALVSGWKLALVGLAFIPLIAMVSIGYSGVMSKYETRYKDVVARIENHAHMTMEGLKTIKVNHLEAYFARMWYELLEDALPPVALKRAVAMGFGDLVNGIIVAISQGTLLYYGAKLVSTGDYTSDMMIQTITFLTLTVTGALSYLTKIPSIARGKRLASYMKDLLYLQPAPEETEGTIIPLLGTPMIRFHEVLFAYDRAFILHDVDFSIHRNEFVAITGPLGAGKSTIGSLLARLYSPRSGKVEVMGTNIAECDIHWLRRIVAFVPQQPQFFDGTVLDNLAAYADHPPTEDEVWQTLKQVHMDEVVAKLSGGLHCRVGDKLTALLLSGGQLQRLAIARALLRRPQIVVFDECTSALDPDNTKAIIDLITTVLAGKYTVVAITHDARFAAAAGRQLIVNGGYVYEEDTSWTQKPQGLD